MMKKLFIYLFLFVWSAQAQLPYLFTQIVHDYHYGYVRNVAIGPDGTIFTFTQTGALNAYSFNGSYFTHQAYIDVDENLWVMEVSPNGTLFLASDDELMAYSFNGISFINITRVNIGTHDFFEISGLAIASDSLVYMSGVDHYHWDECYIWAYRYDGNTFTKTAEEFLGYGSGDCNLAIATNGTVLCKTYAGYDGYGGFCALSYNGSSFTEIASTCQSGNNVTVGSDGTIFLANKFGSLISFTLVDTTFINNASIHNGGSAFDIVAAGDSMVYMATGGDGLRAYSYDGNSFSYETYIDNGGSALDLALSPDGIVFLANHYDGLRAYTYNCDDYCLENIAHINDCGNPYHVILNSDGSIYTAENKFGLRKITYDGTSFNQIARTDEGGEARDIAISPNGTLFLANGSDGLRAYIYNGSDLINSAHINNGGYAESVAIGADSTIFLANGNDGLRAYNYNGSSFTNTAYLSVPDYWYYSDVAIGPHETIFMGCQHTLAAYLYNDTSFIKVASVSVSGYNSSDLIICPDSTVFWANGRCGLHAFKYNGSSFTHITDIDNGGYAENVDYGTDGTIFLANGEDGLRAYIFDGSQFTNTAHINDGVYATGVAVKSDGTVFLCDSCKGLFAYTYSGFTGINQNKSNNPEKFELYQNYPNPFNPTTNIQFTIPKTEFVTLKIYNLLGQEVTILVSNNLKTGTYQYTWDAGSLASGVYVYKIQAGNFQHVRKMMLMK